MVIDESGNYSKFWVWKNTVDVSDPQGRVRPVAVYACRRER